MMAVDVDLDFNTAAPQAAWQPSMIGAYALRYARKGFSVFPIVAGDKIPLNLCDAPCFASLPKKDQTGRYICQSCGCVYEAGTRGFHVATTDADIIRAWWTRYPSANIGLATGSGFAVLDIDGPTGERSLAALAAAHGPLPSTPEQRSGKGRHYFFRVPVAVKNSAGKLGDGIDVRGDGGYVVVAPSLHPSGRQYQWSQGAGLLDVEMAEAPTWFLAGLQRQKPVMDTNGAATPQGAGAVIENYGRGALAKAYASVSSARENTRNETINSEAFSLGRLVASGAVSEGAARSTLIAAAEALGVLRDERSKTLDTIERGLAAGQTEGARDLSHVGQRARDADAPKKQGGSSSNFRANASENSESEPASRPDPWPVPLAWAGVDPASIPRRQWLYGRYLCRGILSVTVSPGGVGKSSLALAEALQMASGRKLHEHALPGGAIRPWYINLEDPPDELDRRLAGACLHFGIKHSELAGRLFVNSGIDTPLKLAALTSKGQGALDEEAFAHVEQHIRDRGIDAIVVDPFVSSHDLPESDNGMIDRLAKRWAQLAMRCKVAVGLVHHTRKGAPGAEHDAESARGASALIAAARVVRVLNPMTKDEAARANIREELRRLFFRASRDKQNLAPPDADKNWYRMVGVNLGNGTPPAHADADEVGVATRWEWPEAASLVPPGALTACQAAIAAGEYGAAAQSPDWVGNIVASVLGLSLNDAAGKAQVKRLLTMWEASGALYREDVYSRAGRRVRPVMRVGRREESAVAQ